jgi:hypothetical protein
MKRLITSLAMVVLAAGCSADIPTGLSQPARDMLGAQVSAINTRPLSSTPGERIEFQWLHPAFTPGTTVQPDSKPHAGCTGGDLILQSGLTATDPRDWSLPGLGVIPTAQESGVLFDIRQMTFDGGVVRGSFRITNGGKLVDTKTGETFTLRAIGAGHYQGNTSQFVLDLIGTVSLWLSGDAGSLIKQIHHFHYTITPDGDAQFINDYPIDYECLKSAF